MTVDDELVLGTLVECNNCHNRFRPQHSNASTREPCPNCGSTTRVQYATTRNVQKDPTVLGETATVPAEATSPTPEIEVVAGEDEYETDTASEEAGTPASQRTMGDVPPQLAAQLRSAGFSGTGEVTRPIETQDATDQGAGGAAGRDPLQDALIEGDTVRRLQELLFGGIQPPPTGGIASEEAVGTPTVLTPDPAKLNLETSEPGVTRQRAAPLSADISIAEPAERLRTAVLARLDAIADVEALTHTVEDAAETEAERALARTVREGLGVLRAYADLDGDQSVVEAALFALKAIADRLIRLSGVARLIELGHKLFELIAGLDLPNLPIG